MDGIRVLTASCFSYSHDSKMACVPLLVSQFCMNQVINGLLIDLDCDDRNICSVILIPDCALFSL